MATDGTRSDGDGSDDPFTERLNYLITERPWVVIAAFLLLSGAFYTGIGTGEGREAGTDQFKEGLAEYKAMQAMNDAFARPGRSSGGSSISIFVSDENNVLSKQNLLRMLTLEEAIHDEFGGRVERTISPASAMAEGITQGEADTLDRQREVIERLTQSQVRYAVRQAWEMGELDMVSTDFKPNEGSATVTQMAVIFDTPPAASSDENAEYHYATNELIDDIEGFEAGENAIVLSGQIVQDEIDQLLTDTIVLVFPAAIILIVFFLATWPIGIRSI
ncbi:MAG: hypothetical protein U5K37_04685 [Natrialbaceae archaeon]|nr:hypothetical protein [Natrialbaceae archaeon]